MKLELHYQQQINRKTEAAFIKGSAVDSWFQQLEQWNIPAGELSCFILPESIQSVAPAGLFVIFKGEKRPPENEILYPYSTATEAVYLPVHATLYPEASAEELKNTQLWYCQVFHPVIGLVGFEKTDEVNLKDLLKYETSKEIAWSFAHPGAPHHAVLRQLHIEKPSLEEIINSIKEDIGTKPLEDLSEEKEKKKSPVTNTLEKVGGALFGGALFLTAGLINLIASPGNSSPENGSSGKVSSGKIPNNPAGPGLLQQLEKWLSNRIKDLDKKRDSELKRLLDLFETNPEEALKYAIPLDSPYLGRGKTDSPSANLSKNDTTSFSMGGLHKGGKNVDVWNVEKYYQDLRSKYQAAAAKELEAKRYKKAAYIYANLLADFHSAANALEQGKYYNEAAALYLEHLKNRSRAAECYERGGLYTEAIELYVELENYEKAGDLYANIRQEEQANYYYQILLDDALKDNNYMRASTVALTKFHDEEKAKKMLLAGWRQDEKQSEVCLRRFFAVTHNEGIDKLAAQISYVYDHQTPANKKLSFLNVLEGVYLQNTAVPEIEALAHSLAYEIVSEETARGNKSIVHTLKNFIKEDQLIGSDTVRYVHQRNSTLKRKELPPVYKLEDGIIYYSAIVYKDQILILGMQNHSPVLVRGNWDDYFEYHRPWGSIAREDAHLPFVASSTILSSVLIAPFPDVVLSNLILEASSHFNEKITFLYPHSLPPNRLGLCLNPMSGVTVVTFESQILKLHHYALNGALLKTLDCKGDPASKESGIEGIYPGLLYKAGMYYVYNSFSVIRISSDGTFKQKTFEHEITDIEMATTEHLQLAVATTNGIVLIKQDKSYEMQIVTPYFFENIRDFKRLQLRFISDKVLAIAYQKDEFGNLRNKLILFEIDSSNNPHLIKEYELEEEIIEILPGDKRNKFALLTRQGKLIRYDYDLTQEDDWIHGAFL